MVIVRFHHFTTLANLTQGRVDRGDDTRQPYHVPSLTLGPLLAFYPILYFYILLYVEKWMEMDKWTYI